MIPDAGSDPVIPISTEVKLGRLGNGHFFLYLQDKGIQEILSCSGIDELLLQSL